MHGIGPNEPTHRFYLALSVMFGILAAGTAGYTIIEEWSVLDSLYMTVLTISTIGFQEVHPLSVHGRIFTIIIVFLSLSTVAYTVNVATRLLVSGEIHRYMEQRRMRKSMAQMENHFIICGFGRIGRRVCELFKIERVPCVVVERLMDAAEQVTKMGLPVVLGEATEETVLRDAGIDRARCIITAVDSPADNVFITLTARDLNPRIHIVARGESPETGSKLRRAGANRVVYPHQIGGRQMAMAALRPTLDRFMSVEALREKYGVYMEEIHIQPTSDLVGQSLVHAAVSQRFGLTIIAILGKSQTEETVTFNPGSSTVLQAGDALIVLGTEDQLHRLEHVASGQLKV
ncbi:potassium channel protein [bacterium]|nr:potassium channel protein [candidate division CSSED10-310 bacterium]